MLAKIENNLFDYCILCKNNYELSIRPFVKNESDNFLKTVSFSKLEDKVTRSRGRFIITKLNM